MHTGHHTMANAEPLHTSPATAYLPMAAAHFTHPTAEHTHHSSSSRNVLLTGLSWMLPLSLVETTTPGLLVSTFSKAASIDPCLSPSRAALQTH